ncbi:hypothetical protein Btru_003637 [Bulinus truncatus]|nr:hypothetical protein Btru_003637 [Bulinus truncatus]
MEKENYVWVASRRLRNPRNTEEITEAARRNEHGEKGPLKPGRLTRRLKTISSDDLFQNYRPPAYIDHYGNAIPGTELKQNGHREQATLERNPRSDSKSKLPFMRQTSLESDPSVRSVDPVETTVLYTRQATPLVGRLQSVVSSRNSRPKTAVSRSRGDGSRLSFAPEVAEMSQGKPTVSESPISACVYEEDVPVPMHQKVIIRPITAVYNTVRAKRFLEDRLRTMYRRRRATSAASRILNWRHSFGGHQGSSSAERFQTARAGMTTRGPFGRFRMIGFLALHLGRLMQAIKENCEKKTQRSATELQWMAVYSENHDDSLAFNKHLFSRDRVSTHVPDWAITILNMPPEVRSEQHCRRLHALLRGLRSFDKFTEEMQMSLCRAFTIERVEEGRVVLKSGHVGLNFYFIYSGSVFVNSEDVSVEGNRFMRTVAILSRGESFGELALLQDIRRTATISVREKCELLVVDKDVFASVCPKIFEKELAEKQNFISTLDLFSSSFWSPEAIHSLCMNAQIQEFKINKVIVANSCIEDWIYACMEGKCRVIRCVSLDAPLNDGTSRRKQSDVVLSEEILQLLAAAAGGDHQGSSHNTDEGDMKENLLTSLGLDYVQTSKKLYLDNSDARERKRAILGLNETTTLTALIKKERESKKEIVFLDVGVIESGEIFDLPSLLENPESESASTLMLVSSGAKLLRIKKAAFFDQASQSALDNTRTLASKQRNPSQETILASYKVQLQWDQFKSHLVQSIVKRPDPFLSKSNILIPTTRVNLKKISVTDDLEQNNLSMRSIADNEDKDKSHSLTDEQDIDNLLSIRHTELVGRRRKSNYFEDIESVNKKDTVIIRRQPSAVRQQLRISKTSKPSDVAVKINSIRQQGLVLGKKR